MSDTEQEQNDPISHDQNFKNLLMDFPEEALYFFYPDAHKTWGSVENIEFVRQEPR